MQPVFQDRKLFLQISERMWSLWPQIVECFYEWAVDYFDHIAGALENYINKGTEHFLQPTSGYLQQVPCPRAIAPCLNSGAE